MERAMRGAREIEVDSFENYRQKYPEDQPLCTYKSILEDWVKAYPNGPGFTQGKRRLTRRQFDERTNKIANGLLNLGLKKGDRVAIDGFNSIEWMEAYWGASKAGFVPVNINPRFVADEIKYVLEDSDSLILFTEDRWVDTIEEIRKDLPLLKEIIVYNAPGYPPTRHPKDPIYKDYEDFMRENSNEKPKLDWDVRNDDFCYLMYTGGTTGWPKGVVYDNWNRVGSMRWGMAASGFYSAWEKVIGALPINETFAKGTIRSFLNSMIPGLYDILSPIINPVLESKGIMTIVSSVLTSKPVKRLIFQNLFHHILGTPLGYIITKRLTMILPAYLMHGLGYEANFTWMASLGTDTIYIEPSQPFNARIFWETVEREKPKSIAIVGDAFMIPMLEELDRAKDAGKSYDTKSLWIIATSGVRWSAHLKKRFLKHIPQIFILDMYGTTESGIGFGYASTSTDEDIEEHTTPSLPEKVGFAANNLILDLDTGKPAKPGCKHAQYVYGGFMGLGYWKAPSKTKKDFITINGERYFMVGDEGYVDEKGGFHLLGRGGGYVINSGGEKVYSEEVEEKIRSHPKVKDVGVVGIPDEKWGEAVTAIVELKEGEKATEDEIKDYLRGKLAAYKIPKNIVFQQVLRTDVGKMMRSELIGLAKKEIKK